MSSDNSTNTLDITPFTHENVLEAFLKITTDKNAIKYLTRLKDNMRYTAPEIRDDKFWNGTKNYNSLPEILNKYCNDNNTENIEISRLFSDVVKQYQQSGFVNSK